MLHVGKALQQGVSVDLADSVNGSERYARIDPCGWASGQQCVPEGTERVDIRPWIKQSGVRRQLGRGKVASDGSLTFSRDTADNLLLDEYAQTEVDQPDAPPRLFRNEDIAWPQITVNHAGHCVGVMERFGNLDDNPECMPRSDAPMLFNYLLQTAALDHFHPDVWSPPQETHIVHSDDVRVLQREQDPCFPKEALEVAFTSLRERGRKYLHGEVHPQ